MVKFSICPLSCIIHLKFIPHWLIFYINYIYTKYIQTYTTFLNKLLQLLVSQLTHKKFWFVWFFLIFQLYLHKLPYYKMHTDHVNFFVPLFSPFLQYFTVAPPIPVGLQSFWRNPVESSGVQWNGSGFHRIADWNWNRTGICSKYMCTNSCKHKYGI